MKSKVRNLVGAAVVTVLASMALASPNVGLVACIDEGASSRTSIRASQSRNYAFQAASFKSAGLAVAARERYFAEQRSAKALTAEEEMQHLHEAAFKAQVAQRQAAASNRNLMRTLALLGIGVT